jgi:DNA-binding NtrC family response regulator
VWEEEEVNPNILIVDDEPNVRLMYRSALDDRGYDIHEADSAEDALKQCLSRKHDIAILDLRMPGGMNGLELLQAMAERRIQTPVVIITAHGDAPNAALAMKLGAIDFLKKPILPDELRNIVKDVLIRHGPEEVKGKARDSEYYLRCAKRAINLRDFAAAKRDLVKALDLDAKSPQAINLVRVMLEMRAEYEQAGRL